MTAILTHALALAIGIVIGIAAMWIIAGREKSDDGERS